MRFLFIFALLTSVVFARDFYSIKDKSIDGKDFKMEDFKGKVVLVVNIASQCGHTPQLEKLEALYQRYRNKNFVVLGVPTNDFGGQTPEGDKAMMDFCQKNYNVTFPLLGKKTIQGKKKRELYKFLTEESSKKFQGEVSWNFEKFLVNRKGEVVGRMRSSLDPLEKAMIQQIEPLL